MYETSDVIEVVRFKIWTMAYNKLIINYSKEWATDGPSELFDIHFWHSRSCAFKSLIFEKQFP